MLPMLMKWDTSNNPWVVNENLNPKKELLAKAGCVLGKRVSALIRKVKYDPWPSRRQSSHELDISGYSHVEFECFGFTH
jgi:hypothetical protein